MDGRYINLSIMQAFSNKVDTYITSFLRFLNGIFRSPLYRYPKMKKAVVSCCRFVF